MSKNYASPEVGPIEFDFEDSILPNAQAYMTLSRKDVLGIVNSAFAQLGADRRALVAVKREVLEAVVEGRLAEALRIAIVGAGQAGRD